MLYRYWKFEDKDFEQRTTRSVFTASLFHVLIVLGIYFYPELTPPPPPSAGAVTVSFEALGDAKGSQTYVKKQNKKANLNPSKRAAQKPKPILAKSNEVIIPKKKPSKKVSNAKKAAKKLIAKKTHKPKPILAKAPPSADTSSVAVENPVDKLDTLPDKEVQEEIMAAESITDDTLKEEAPPSPPVISAKEETPQEPPKEMGAELSPGTNTPSDALQQQEQSLSASPSALPEKYGVPEGTKSYLDLRQRPGNRKPVYPYLARRKYQEGKTVLLYYVNPDGSISGISVARSSGFASLDNSAVEAIKSWHYYPGQSGWAIHPINFYLNGPSQESIGRLRTR